jgi:hypothetical protein
MQDVCTIQIGSDYFRKCARKEYSQEIPYIWTREAIQNSVDAGSSLINITVDDSFVIFEDNGHGMDNNIISDKLLTLGGSFKDSETATGGFGKAKEVLFFCWGYWEIESRPTTKDSYYVSSEMINKEPIRKTQGSFKTGTLIKIKYESDSDSKDSWIANIKDFLKFCTMKAHPAIR